VNFRRQFRVVKKKLQVGHQNPGAMVYNLELTPYPLLATHAGMPNHREVTGTVDRGERRQKHVTGIFCHKALRGRAQAAEA
jgi:exosome complex RNA-binding protein Rrp42 (RNase PH superfamily)